MHEHAWGYLMTAVDTTGIGNLRHPDRSVWYIRRADRLPTAMAQRQSDQEQRHWHHMKHRQIELLFNFDQSPTIYPLGLYSQREPGGSDATEIPIF
jgi:hypothetical protein